MLLTEFFNSPEGDSYANYTPTSQVAEAKRKPAGKKYACKKGERMVGSKIKNGKRVPDCVSKSKKIAEDSWSNQGGGGNAWNNGEDQWHSEGNGDPSGSSGMMEDTNPEDTITVDVPLFIRLLEYAREDAKTDMDLHKVTERITALSAEGRTLSMDDYNQICGKE